MNAHPLLRLLLLLTGFSALATAQASTRQDIQTEENSNIKVSVTNYFDENVDSGYFPIKVRIANGSNRQGTWTLSHQSNSYAYHGNRVQTDWQQTFTVPAGQIRSFEALCPIITSSYSQQMTMTGPATRGDIWFSSQGYTSGGRTLYALGSESIIRDYGGRIESYIEGNNYELRSGSMKLDLFPRNWRAYSGVDLIWFQQSDWEKLLPAQRQPILQWVAQGGDLRILKDGSERVLRDDTTGNNFPVSGLPGAGKGLTEYGLGFIRVYPPLTIEELFGNDFSLVDTAENSNETPATERLVQINDELGADFWLPVEAESQPYRDFPPSEGDVSVQGVYELRQPNVTLIIFSMLGFVIIVGPINLWVFARGRKRTRLLITTPLISLAFCLVIAGAILLADGVGGQGQITRVFIHPEDSNQEVLLESQYAQTGLLLGRTFTPGDVWVSPLGNRTALNNTYQLSGKYGLNNETYWGEWFGSRRVQGVAIRDVRPTRSGFEIRRQGDTLTVVSSFPGFCSELYLIGEDGQSYYHAQGVATGTPTVLEPATEAEFKDWIAKCLRRLDGATFLEVSRLASRPGHIYAAVERYSGETPQTVSGIDWHTYQSLVIAPAQPSPMSSEEAAQ